MLLPYCSLKDLPAPVQAFDGRITIGTPLSEATSFKAALVHNGSARLQGNFTPFTAEAGDLILIRPGTLCASVSLAPVEIAVVQVHPEFLVDQLRWIQPRSSLTRRETYKKLLTRAQQPVHLRLDDTSLLGISGLFAQLVVLSKQSTMFGRMIVRTTELIWTIESLLMASQRSPTWGRRFAEPVAPLERQEVTAVLQAIHERYASDLSIAELARKVALSESALRRAVLAATGFSPREYLHRVRLARFEELVAETSVPLADAARMVGWESASHARAAFARSRGMSPREFRAEAREARRADWRRGSGVELDAPPEVDYPAR